MPGPYRHSVWIDVFGVVCLGALLLVPLGYLATTMMGRGGGGGGSSIIAGARSSVSAPTRRPDRTGRPPRLPAPSNPLFGGGPAGEGVSGIRAPFSSDWREQANPSLTDPSTGSPSGGAQVGRGGSGQAGPTIATRRPLGTTWGETYQGGRRGGSSWRSEAQTLSSRARALAGQLGQMDRSATGKTNSARSGKTKTASGGRSSSSAASDPGTPGDPSQVPIDDHVHWLAVFGLLWGVWRIWRGA